MFKRLMWGLFIAVLFITTSWVMAEESPFPEPTGEYKVGVTSRHMVDADRDETYPSAVKGSQRELMVYFWYPADVKEGAAPAFYMPDAASQLDTMIEIAKTRGQDIRPSVEKLPTYPAHAYTDMPVALAEDSYPILIFSHLWSGFGLPQTYTAQLEELASHGYIVAAINHTYASPASVFPDGRVLTFDFSIDPDGSAPIWVEDQLFVMNELEKLNASDSTFAGRLDLTKLGVFGHSMGGQTAASTCVLDERCKAFINEDGNFVEPALNGFKIPYMYMSSDSDFDVLTDLATLSSNAYYNLRFTGFEHLNFSDTPLWEHNTIALGSVDKLHSVEITRAYVLAFFNRHLKGMSEPLLDGPSADYPEVHYDMRDH